MSVTVLERNHQPRRMVTFSSTQLVIQLHPLFLYTLHDLDLGSPLHRFAKSTIFFLKAAPKDHSQTWYREVRGKGWGTPSIKTIHSKQKLALSQKQPSCPPLPTVLGRWGRWVVVEVMARRGMNCSTWEHHHRGTVAGWGRCCTPEPLGAPSPHWTTCHQLHGSRPGWCSCPVGSTLCGR